MSTRQGFIDAVTASPADDALWSVFADWLDDHGEPARAELIRLECELERLAPAEDRALELRRRTEDLLVENERVWLGDWVERLVRWQFRRGFLHDVTLQPETFCRDGAALLREHPVYRFAFVDDEGGCIAPEAVDEVVAAPHMAAVRCSTCRPARSPRSTLTRPVRAPTPPGQRLWRRPVTSPAWKS